MKMRIPFPRSLCHHLALAAKFLFEGCIASATNNAVDDAEGQRRIDKVLVALKPMVRRDGDLADGLIELLA